jgi:hypothetical protein
MTKLDFLFSARGFFCCDVPGFLHAKLIAPTQYIVKAHQWTLPPGD